MGDAEEELDKLRDELEGMQDDYENKIDILTDEFENRIDSLEDKLDDAEKKIDELNGELKNERQNRAEEVAFLKEDAKNKLEELRYTMASAGGNNWEKEFDEEGNKFYRNKITGETSWEDPTPLNDAGKEAIEKLTELEKELKKLKTDLKKRKIREKAMANEISVFKRNLTEAKNGSELLTLKLQENETKEENMVKQHRLDLERKREEQENDQMAHEEKHMKQYIESIEIKKRMAQSRREAKMIIDEMKEDITGMYEMQKRAMGLGGGRRRK
eukprot:g5508.t1